MRPFGLPAEQTGEDKQQDQQMIDVENDGHAEGQEQDHTKAPNSATLDGMG